VPNICRVAASAYPIISIEDGMAEDDWDGWKALTDHDRRQVPAGWRRSVRDQPARLRDGIKDGRRQFAAGQGQPDRHPV
jgi:enolase